MAAMMCGRAHIMETRQQVEGEEGFQLWGGLGPARHGTSRCWQGTVTHVT